MTKKYKYLLSTVLMLVFAKELVFVFITKPWGNHDEAAHFSYTQYLAEEKKMPIYQGKFKTPYDLSFSEEYAVSKIAVNNSVTGGIIPKVTPELGRHSLKEYSNPDFQSLYYKLPADGEYKNAAVLYPPLYYAAEGIPYLLFYKANVFARSYAMRVFSALIFLATVYFCFLIAMRLSKKFYFSLALTALIGFQPIFSYVESGINNDVLLTGLATATIYFIIRLIDELNIKNSVWLGLCLGLGLLTKQQFFIFPALALIPFIYHLKISREKFQKIIRLLLLVIVITIGLAGWWYIRNFLIYQSFLTVPSLPEAYPQFLNLQIGQYFHIIFTRYFYIFTTFGYNRTFNLQSGLPISFMVLGALSAFLSLFGLIWLYLKNKKTALSSDKVKQTFLVLSILSLEAVYLYLFLKNLLNYGKYTFPVEGRYFFPLILPIYYLYLKGLDFLAGKKCRTALYLLLILASVIGNVIIWTNVLLPKIYL
ncbi:MAG: DUF2142 domain-containing protein [Patescibacteria group bacterium]|jgi:4-amino-4-deoxy-L-arabinose transferase-like glycosyltransferase